ncbi:hypothetical protein [Peribacillus asahii]|uniref:hypothetical protein n=1 Tax=Peribacillus asahii TaxID=228899 RepID=UPI00207A5BD2|nr:hypothetical protein [Peribacillus asahii]USK72685.1 hypothetical protein LIS76_23375 [Peribacillus asahii]USK72763.1 hypothetical protein LIS76_23955 [Peribacillus asahii]
MVEEKSWKEFQNSGLIWFINKTLHLFGWAIVLEISDGEIIRAYPARVKFRGFSEDVNTEGYITLSKYLEDNVNELSKEAQE